MSREEAVAVCLLGLGLFALGALMMLFVQRNTSGLRLIEILLIVIGGLLGVWSLLTLFRISEDERRELTRKLEDWNEALRKREERERGKRDE